MTFITKNRAAIFSIIVVFLLISFLAIFSSRKETKEAPAVTAKKSDSFPSEKEASTLDIPETEQTQATPREEDNNPIAYAPRNISEDASLREASDPCTSPHTESGIGRPMLPVSPQYAHLDFLGQIFTAEDCSNERIEEVWGVQNGQYKIGVLIELYEPPAQKLRMLLEELGFVCPGRASADQCVQWEFQGDSISVKELLRLKMHAQNMLRDDCILCG